MKRTPLRRVSKKPKKKGRDPIKTLRNKCDGLLTPIVKKMHTECLLCGNETQVAHHHLRKSTSNACRYYIPNLVPLCTICHCKLHHDEILWTGRVVEIMGFDWLHDLEEKKKETVKISQTYYKEHFERLTKIHDSL